MPIRWTRREPSGHRYALTGKHMILVRQENGNFEGRWQGVWDPPIKVLDWVRFAIKVNGEIHRLHEHPKTFEYCMNRAIHTYRFGNLRVRERVFVPERLEAVCSSFHILNKGEEEIKIYILPKFNLRLEDNRNPDTVYEKPRRNQITIYDPHRYALICRNAQDVSWIGILGINKEPTNYYLGNFSEDMLREGWKGNGTSRSSYGLSCLEYATRQRKIDLNVFLSSSFESEENAVVTYTEASRGLKRRYSEKKRVYRDAVKRASNVVTPRDDFNNVVLSAKANIEMLSHSQKGMGFGILAGLPSYAMYYGRDLCWTILGVNPIGYFQYVRDSLLLLAKYQGERGKNRGRIPHEIRPNGELTYPSVDSTLLFIIAVHDYYKWTGDKVFLQLIDINVKNALRWCFSRTEKGEFMPHGAEEFLKGTTWMDSYYRGKYGVDVQALWLKALECAEELERERGDYKSARKCASYSEGLRDRIIREFWNPDRGFFYDRIGPNGKPDPVLTINPSLLLMFKYLDEDRAKQVLDLYESEIFTADFGVRTRAKGEKNYDPNSYHKGSIWPLGTAWVASAEFMYNRKAQGWEYTKKLASLADEYSLGAITEVLPGDRVERILKGCFIQAWSSSMLLYLTIRHLFGIDPAAHRNQVTIDPFLPEDWNHMEIKNLQIGESILNISCNRAKEGVRTEISNEGEPITVRIQGEEIELGRNQEVVI